MLKLQGCLPDDLQNAQITMGPNVPIKWQGTIVGKVLEIRNGTITLSIQANQVLEFEPSFYKDGETLELTSVSLVPHVPTIDYRLLPDGQVEGLHE